MRSGKAWTEVLALALLGLLPWRGPAAEHPELVLQLGHSATLTGVASSADGRHALTGSKDMTAILWDTATGLQLRSFVGHEGSVRALALSADGKQVLTGSEDGTAILWDAAMGKQLRSFVGHKDHVVSVALSADGKRVLTGSADDTAILWEAGTGQQLRSFVLQGLHSVALSADGKRALLGSVLWDVATGKEIRSFQGRRGGALSAAMSADGKQVLVGASDSSAILWDAATGKEVRSFAGVGGRYLLVAMSADGKRALTRSEQQPAILWDVATGQRLGSLTGQAPVKAAALSADGRQVILAWGDRTAIVWDMARNNPLRSLVGRLDRVSSLALSMDGKHVLTGSEDSRAILWEVATGRMLRSFTGHKGGVRSVALSPDGKQALTGSRDATAILWEVATGKQIRSFAGHLGEVTSVALSTDGKLALTGSRDYTAILWDVATGKQLRTLTGHKRAVLAVALSADGTQAITGSKDGTAILWEVGTGKQIRSFSEKESVVLSLALRGDGKQVLAGLDDHTAVLWDAATGKELHSFAGHSGGVSSVALSADGKRAFTGSWDKTVILWDAESGRPLQTFSGHNDDVTQVTPAGSGAFFATASNDGAMRIWKPGRNEPVYSFLNAGEEWLFWTPEGYYTCSPKGDDLIAWRIDDPEAPGGCRVVGPERFRKTFHRLDLFRHLLEELDLTRALAKAGEDTGSHNIRAALPPLVVLSSPRPRDVIETDDCEITAVARGSGNNPVTTLTILLNGRELRDQDNRSLRKRFTDPRARQVRAVWKVKLPPGEHSLEIQADTRLGTTDTSLAIPITRKEGKAVLPRLFLYGVGVGAEDYQKSELRTAGVKYCRDDVKRFTAAMQMHARSLYADIEVLGPTDGVPSRANIIDGFETLADKVRASPNAVTIVFMAGHGDTRRGSFYFLCADADDRKPAVNGLSTLQLKEALGKIPGRVILFMDACYSGAVGGDHTRDVNGLTDDLISELSAKGSGVAVITSSRGMQKSLSDRINKGGYFTLALVEALGGGASKSREGVVYLPAVYAYVSEKVKERTTNEKEGPQYPYASDLEKLSEKPLPISKP